MGGSTGDTEGVDEPYLPEPTLPEPTLPEPVLPAPTQPDADVPDPTAPSRSPADEMATRNVPRATPRRDLGIPAAPAAPVSPAAPGTQPPFERPELEPMRRSSIGLVVGRGLIAVAALLVGIGARSATDGSAGAFWPIVIVAGGLTAVGAVAQIVWSTRLAENARRLRTRTVSARGMVWSWLAPMLWVAVSCLTYLRVEVDAELDPLPGVAAIGWMITLSIPYARLQGVFRGLSRTPPNLWLTVFPIDLIAIGVVWWRLTGWPDPIGDEVDLVTSTSNIAFGAAAALALSAALFGWLAKQADSAVAERLGRLEAQHRPQADETAPEWFRAGVPVPQPSTAPPLPAAPPPAPAAASAGPPGPAVPLAGHGARTLLPTRTLGRVVVGAHVIWGLSQLVLGGVLTALAFEYSGRPVFLGDQLIVADSDADRVALAGGLVGLATVLVVIVHGVWAVVSATNGRRVTVHAPNPGTFVVAFAPMPVLVIAGVAIGGTVGYWMVVIGLSVAFFALILGNQLLMALSARLGGRLSGFGRWSSCLAVTYLSGVFLNVVFSFTPDQVGLYASLSIVQGGLVIAGVVIGAPAIRDLDTTMREYRQRGRTDV